MLDFVVTINPQTDQELFNTAYKGVVGQKKQSSYKDKDDNTICVYRLNGGEARCAFGWLIPDDQYKPGMEGKNAHAFQLNVDGNQKTLIRNMQLIHDDYNPTKHGGDFIIYFKNKMKMLAERNKLVVPEI